MPAFNSKNGDGSRTVISLKRNDNAGRRLGKSQTSFEFFTRLLRRPNQLRWFSPSPSPLEQQNYSRLKGARLVFSSCEVHLMGERARKNAEMAPFNLNNWLPGLDSHRRRSRRSESMLLQQKSPKGFDVAPGTGLEPATSKLTASCSTIELPGTICNERTPIIAYFSVLW